MVNIKNYKRYYKKERDIPRMVLKKTGDNEIIYGTRALNARFPYWLDRETEDYDIYSKTPAQDAREVEKLIDKRMMFDATSIKKAQHEGTMKVISNVTGKGIADYTIPEEIIPFDKIKGKKYVTLKHIEKGARKTLQDPESAYRHDKDKDTIQRIKIYRKYKKKGLKRRVQVPALKTKRRIKTNIW